MHVQFCKDTDRCTGRYRLHTALRRTYRSHGAATTRECAEIVRYLKQHVSYQLLEQWLTQRPPPEMFARWKAYIHALSATLSEQARKALKTAVLDRAQEIAHAAGGFLGIGSKVSKTEKAVPEDIERSFL
jgi:hypothetical protein